MIVMSDWIPSLISGGCTIIAVLLAGWIASRSVNKYQKKQDDARKRELLIGDLLEIGKSITNASLRIIDLVSELPVSKKAASEAYTNIGKKMIDYTADFSRVFVKMNIHLKITDEEFIKLDRKADEVFDRLSDVLIGKPFETKEKRLEEGKKAIFEINQFIDELIYIVYKNEIT